jgi:hypothetical protein
MVGVGIIEAEPDISKILQLHMDWWVMLAGNGISPAFDIVDDAKSKLRRKKTVSVDEAARAVFESYRKKRAEEAEAKHLAPIGWTLQQFNSRASAGIIPDAQRASLAHVIQSHYLEVSLLVAGFDSRGRGHIFTVDDGENRGASQRHDIPGFHSIGSGSYGAIYMMAYRELSPAMPIREALYYVVEGKYFGERAAGVGLRTDLYILRFGKPRVKIKESVVDDKLMKLCGQLEPRRLGREGVDVLNSLHGERMDTVPKLKTRREGRALVIAT